MLIFFSIMCFYMNHIIKIDTCFIMRLEFEKQKKITIIKTTVVNIDIELYGGNDVMIFLYISPNLMQTYKHN